jgi:hypothetical protein
MAAEVLPGPVGDNVAHESRILVESLALARIVFSSKSLDTSISLDHTRSRFDHWCASLPLGIGLRFLLEAIL